MKTERFFVGFFVFIVAALSLLTGLALWAAPELSSRVKSLASTTLPGGGKIVQIDCRLDTSILKSEVTVEAQLDGSMQPRDLQALLTLKTLDRLSAWERIKPGDSDANRLKLLVAEEAGKILSPGKVHAVHIRSFVLRSANPA
jgi:hypothetical protein